VEVLGAFINTFDEWVELELKPAFNEFQAFLQERPRTTLAVSFLVGGLLNLSGLTWLASSATATPKTAQPIPSQPTMSQTIPNREKIANMDSGELVKMIDSVSKSVDHSLILADDTLNNPETSDPMAFLTMEDLGTVSAPLLEEVGRFDPFEPLIQRTEDGGTIPFGPAGSNGLEAPVKDILDDMRKSRPIKWR
jgi:hypothetical protein